MPTDRPNAAVRLRRLHHVAESDSTRRAAVVTGATSGIGRAIALKLAAHGDLVWCVGRRAELLDQLAVQTSGAARPWPLDLTGPDLSALADAVAAEGLGLVAIVHCAGSYTADLLGGGDESALVAMLDINAIAPYRLTRALLPHMRDAGTIVFLNSSQGLSASTGVGHYAASKHALKAVADSLRGEVNHRGIRVTSVYAGRTATPMQEAVYAGRGESYQPQVLLQPEHIAELVHMVLQLPAAAEVTDVSIRPTRPRY